MGLHDFTLYSIIRRNAALHGDKTAWRESETGRQASFHEIAALVDRLAGGLQALGIAPGDRIGILGKNSLEYFLLYGAAAAAGAVMLPINWRLSAGEVCFNLKDGNPRAVFFDPEFADTIEQIRGDLPGVAHFQTLADDDGASEDFRSLLESGPFRPVDVPANAGAVIIHTAAVAGSPRGALLSHGNIIASSHQFMQCMALSGDDIHLNLLPMFHVGGLFIAVSCFHAGALTLNMRKFDAAAAAGLIASDRASVLFDFAPILGSIIDAAEAADLDIGSLQAVIGLDGPQTIERYQKLTGGTFYVMFGQTETACLATVGPYNARPGSAGRTVPAAEVILLDAADQPVATGETGEIAVRGPMVFLEYINLPDDTAQTFRGGWHHTGDLGRFDKEGYLFYMGRKAEKELIKPGGENVYPAEVEKTILLHPAIARTVVFGVPDPKWKEGIKAVCEVKPGCDITAKELIDFVGERIARFKKPQYVEFVSSLPLLANGQPDREKVKQDFA